MPDEHHEARQEVGGHEAFRRSDSSKRGGNYRLHLRSYPGGLSGSPQQLSLFTGRPVRNYDAKGREGAFVSWSRGAVDSSP
jgi:hypothetical protein